MQLCNAAESWIAKSIQTLHKLQKYLLGCSFFNEECVPNIVLLFLLLLRNVDISLQLKSEPMRSPFALALLKAECVLLAVDETFEPLRRSWCC